MLRGPSFCAERLAAMPETASQPTTEVQATPPGVNHTRLPAPALAQVPPLQWPARPSISLPTFRRESIRHEAMLFVEAGTYLLVIFH